MHSNGGQLDSTFSAFLSALLANAFRSLREDTDHHHNLAHVRSRDSASQMTQLAALLNHHVQLDPLFMALSQYSYHEIRQHIYQKMGKRLNSTRMVISRANNNIYILYHTSSRPREVLHGVMLAVRSARGMISFMPGVWFPLRWISDGYVGSQC